ncbi:MAG: hypothetical protein IJU87_03475, partial [Lachnospiraceae bacterium]|nr:hypothetical protein [Lachnospiraceae bacterium]
HKKDSFLFKDCLKIGNHVAKCHEKHCYRKGYPVNDVDTIKQISGKSKNYSEGGMTHAAYLCNGCEINRNVRGF